MATVASIAGHTSDRAQVPRYAHTSALCCLGVALLLTACSEDGSSPRLNHRPVILQLPDTTSSLGDTLRLRAEAADSDGDAVQYRLTVVLNLEEVRIGYHPRAGIDGATGDFWFAPKVDDRPTRGFKITATDPFGGRDSTRFEVLVP